MHSDYVRANANINKELDACLTSLRYSLLTDTVFSCVSRFRKKKQKKTCSCYLKYFARYFASLCSRKLLREFVFLFRRFDPKNRRFSKDGDVDLGSCFRCIGSSRRRPSLDFCSVLPRAAAAASSAEKGVTKGVFLVTT